MMASPGKNGKNINKGGHNYEKDSDQRS
jgi:hypothetical protein